MLGGVIGRVNAGGPAVHPESTRFALRVIKVVGDRQYHGSTLGSLTIDIEIRGNHYDGLPEWYMAEPRV